MLAGAQTPFAAHSAEIDETERNSPVIASDETSARVNGKTHWQWTFIAPTAVSHTIAGTRATPPTSSRRCAAKVWLSDRLPRSAARRRASVLSCHLIRDAQLAIDAGDTIFAPPQTLSAKGVRHRPAAPDLADATIKSYARDLGATDRLLDSSRRRRTAASPGQLQVDGHDKLLVFMTRRDSSRNNGAERECGLGDLPQSDERLRSRGAQGHADTAQSPRRTTAEAHHRKREALGAAAERLRREERAVRGEYKGS